MHGYLVCMHGIVINMHGYLVCMHGIVINMHGYLVCMHGIVIGRIGFMALLFQFFLPVAIAKLLTDRALPLPILIAITLII